MPELLSTVRQQTEQERETSLLFREGQATEALARKREDGTAQIVPGGYQEAFEHVAALWQVRRQANAHDPTCTLSVSAPTNANAREIAAAIRVHRRTAGELEPNQVVLQAADQNGVAYDLPLAVGDRVRLFARTNAAISTGAAASSATMIRCSRYARSRQQASRCATPRVVKVW